MTASAREIIARAIEGGSTSGKGFDVLFREWALREADAILSALEGAGMVIVEREPTEAMIEAGVQLSEGPTWGDRARTMFTVMIDEATKTGE